MALRRLAFGSGTVASILLTSLLVAVGCSSAGDVSFDPVAGSPGVGANGGDGNSTGGSKTSGAGSGTGATSSQAGKSNTGGTDGNGGTGATAGTESNGGTDSGGTDTGGTDTGGTDTGGTAGSGQGGGAGSTAGGGMGGGGTGGGGMGGKGGTGGGPSCTPTPEVCDGLDNNCDKLVDPAGTCPDGCTGAIFEGHLYYFCGLTVSGQAAALACVQLGMYAVAIESAAENEFVVSKLKGSSWLGATDAADEQHWVWSTGESFWEHGKLDGKYSNWLEGQPNNDNDNDLDENCAVISTAAAQKGRWNDLYCGFDLYRATCEASGLVPGPIPL